MALFRDNDVREHLKYLALVLLVIFLLAAFNNATLGEEDTISIGYCNVTLACTGIDAGFCIGIEQQERSCVDVMDVYGTETDKRMRAEVECALQAYKICDKRNMDRGTEWAQYATHNNNTCRQLNQEENVQLIDCFDTYRPLKWPKK